MQVHEQCQGERQRPVEARLLLGHDEVIAGTIAAGREGARPFHGWLELMDALDEIRAGTPCKRGEER